MLNAWLDVHFINFHIIIIIIKGCEAYADWPKN